MSECLNGFTSERVGEKERERERERERKREREREKERERERERERCKLFAPTKRRDFCPELAVLPISLFLLSFLSFLSEILASFNAEFNQILT